MKNHWGVAVCALLVVLAASAYLKSVLIPNRPAFAPETTERGTLIPAPDLGFSSSLSEGEPVASPLSVTGTATLWYFEGSFPVSVVDPSGNTLFTGPAQAQDEWMTESPVPYTVTIDVGSYKGPAKVIFRKDNPSGDPERDASVSVSVIFN